MRQSRLPAQRLRVLVLLALTVATGSGCRADPPDASPTQRHTTTLASEPAQSEAAVSTSTRDSSPPLLSATPSESEHLGADWIRIEPGRCRLAIPSWEDTVVEYDVDLTRAYEIMATEVTIEMWRQVGRQHQVLDDAHFERCDAPNCPVASISWLEAARFANLASMSVGLAACYDLSSCHHSDEGWEQGCERWPAHNPDCKGLRLPTLAEWECAARAGRLERFICGDEAECLATSAWTRANSEGTFQPVGLLEPNTWGLYDLNGNVAEYVFDTELANAEYYRRLTEVLVDPVHDDGTATRMRVGGSVATTKRDLLRLGMRFGRVGSLRSTTSGLRLVRTVD